MADFTTLNNFFDHIYIITLRRATERQEAIKKNLAGLKYDFFFGIDKQEHSMAEMARDDVYDMATSKKNNRYNKPITHGHICCSWSHRNVYQDILKNGYQKTLVLEDDVVPVDNIEAFAPGIFNELPENWELLYFDFNKNETRNVVKQYWYHVQKFFGGLTWSHTTVQNLYPKKISAHLATAGYHDYTSAYAITAAAAQKLIQLQTPITFNADNLLAHACTNKLVNGLIGKPKLFSQLSQGSNKLMVSYVED